MTTRARLHRLIRHIPTVLGAEGRNGLREELLSKGWINVAKDRSKWGKMVHAVCGIDGDPVLKNNPKAEYVLEQRPYYATFDDDD